MQSMESMESRTRAIWAPLVLALAASLMLGACATRSSVEAQNEIATAMFAIRDARVNGAEVYALAAKLHGAEVYAAEELGQAEKLLGSAQTASGTEAERLAEESTVHAQLAAAIAARESARTQKQGAKQLEREAGALRKRTTDAVEEQSR